MWTTGIVGAVHAVDAIVAFFVPHGPGASLQEHTRIPHTYSFWAYLGFQTVITIKIPLRTEHPKKASLLWVVWALQLVALQLVADGQMGT